MLHAHPPRACAFFDELEGFNPVVLPCTSNTHPDKVLRKLGIIETHARLNIGDVRVFFSSDRQEWLAEDSVKPRALTHRTRWGVHSRVDRTPKAVIQVIGEAEWIEEDKEKQRRVVKQRIIAEKRRREDGPCVSQAEENSEYEAARLIEQYIVSGLPEAAKKTEAMIIAKGTGRLSQLVGRGVHVSQDQGVGWGFPTTQIRLGRTIVLGISREVQNLSPHFTHHLIVRNSAKYTEHYPVSSPKGRRPGEEKKSGLGEPGQADNSLTESQDGWSQEQDSDEDAESGLGYDTAHFELHDTSAKKAFTFGAAADTVVPFRRKTTKCNGFVCACPGGNHPCFKLLKHEEFLEGDMMLLSGYEEGSDRAQELQALVLSQCTCGKTLGFFEIGKCKCGRYDFEHISWVQKRRRHLMIRKSGILKDPFIIDHLAFFCGGVVRVPDRREVTEYAHRLVTILSRGFSHSFTSKNIRHRGRNKNPPTRTRVPVVTVFAGGDLHDKFVLAKHVHKRWPIVVIEGTGGYADHLCQIIDKVHCIVLKSVVRGLDQAALDRPNTRPANDGGKQDKTRKVLAAGLDDYRVFLSSIDSVTAEILINGHIDIARRGTNPKEFVRKVENAIQGNEVLTKAWLLYAQWITNAQRQEARYFSGERLIILLSTVLTAMSVFHTFLLLINDGGTAPPFVPEEANVWAIVWIVVPWSVIILPIVISGTIALTRVLQPGPKWVVLKSCSEQLLSEIYKYRTRTNAYSKESIAEHVRGAVSAQYTTPEELLQVKAADLIEVLNGSIVASVTLEQYEGMIPPPWIRATSDSGFGLLSPDVYRDVRVDYNQRFVGCKARRTSLLKGHVECSELFMSALATFLAVASNFGYPYVACWTVLAICISTNMSKWLSNTRIGATVQRLNTTANKLSTVSMWWTGLGPSADRQSNRNTLVEETEAALLDLELMWGSIISQGDGRQKIRPPGRDSAKVKKPVQSLKSVGAKHGVDLEVLTSANLFDVVSDPNTGHKENVLKSAAAVLGALGKSVDGAASAKHRASGTAADDSNSSTDSEASDTPIAAPVTSKKTAQEHKADALTGLVCTRSDMLCRALMEAIPPRREVVSRVTWLIKSRRTATKWLIISGIEGSDHPKARQALQGYTTRQLLELLKHITILELFETLPRYDEIAPCSSKAAEAASAEQPDFTSASYWRETVVSELYLIVTSSIFIDDAGVRGLLDEPMRLVKLVRSASLRQYLMCLKADRIYEIIESARRWIDHRSDSLLGRTVSMFRTTTFRIAEHDCESFLESKQTRLDVWKKIETILSVVTTNTWTQMARMNLLGLFPHNVQQRILNVTRLQLGRYLEIIARGTPASRVFSASHERYDAILRDASEAGQLVPHIFHPVHGDRELRERVVLLSMELSQIDINKFNKGQLRRKVNCTGVTNEALNHILFDLLPDERLRFFLSVLQAKLNNTFTLKIIDRLGDDDLMNLNASALTHVAENLVSGTAVFKGGPPVSQMSKPEIICSFGKKSLHNVLEPLSECQLRTLVQDVLSASCKLYPLFVYAKVLELYPLFQRHHLREITFAWDPGFVTLLIDSCALVSPSTLDGCEASTAAGATSLGEVVPVWASATVTTTATAATVATATTAHTTGTSSTTKSIGTHGNAQPPDYAVPALEEIDFDNVRVEVTKLLIALKQEGIDDVEGQAFLRGLLSTIRENSGDIMLAEIMEDAAVSLLVSPEVVAAIHRFEHGDVPSTARSSSSGRTGSSGWQGGKRSSSRLRKGRKTNLAGSGSQPRPISPSSEPSAADTGSTPRGRTTFSTSTGRPSFDMTSLDNICSSEAMTVVVDLFLQEESQRDGLLTLVSQLVDRTDYFDTPSAPYHKLLNATTADILSAMRPDIGSFTQPSTALQPAQPTPATGGLRTPPRVPALPPIAHSASLVSGAAEDDPETIKLFSVYQKLSVASEWSSDSLRRVVMSCFNSLLFGAPMRLFYELSRRLRTIDIRDIIVGVSHRRLLVFYLFDILHLRLVGPDDVIHPSVTYTTSLEWNGLPQREVPHTHRVPKRNEWRTRLFKESVKLYGGIYRDVVDGLRILSEAQMKLVVEEAARLFEDCEVAHFFVSYLEKVRVAQHCVGGDSAAWRKWLLWYCTVHDLRCRYAKHESAEAFATHFAGFDAEAFMSKPKEARQMSFTKLQLSCEKQAELFTYSAEQAEAELFFYINPASFGPPIRRVTALEGIRKMRAAFWKHIQPIQQASPHGADRRATAGQR